MSQVFRSKLSELEKLLEHISGYKNQKEAVTNIQGNDALDNIIGMMVLNDRESRFYYISLEINKEKLEVKVINTIQTNLGDTVPRDIKLVIYERKNILVTLARDNIIKLYGIKQFEKEDLVNSILCDGGYIYHAGAYGIERINLRYLKEESVITREDLKRMRIESILWLYKRNTKWYILISNRDKTHVLYSTNCLENIENWNEVLHWYIKHPYIASFDFLPDGSVISTVPLRYLDVNGKKIEGFREHESSIYKLAVLPIDNDKAIVFYAGWLLGIWYVSLIKKNNKWKVIKQERLLGFPYGDPIELVTVGVSKLLNIFYSDNV